MAVSSFVGPVPIGAVIVLILFGSALTAMVLARFLPAHHLSAETKGVVSVSMAVVGTLSALVVGLLISTSSASFTSKAQQVTQISADVINLDRMMKRYGPEAQGVRSDLHRYTASKLQDLFPKGAGQTANLENLTTLEALEAVQNGVLSLKPVDAMQQWLQAQALQITGAMIASRWQLGQEGASTTPLPLLLLVMFWFIVMFISFGLFAPRNATAIAMMFLCAMAIGGAIRMTTDLQTPFRGLIRISDAPLTQALDQIGH